MKTTKKLFPQIIDALVDKGYIVIPDAFDIKLSHELLEFAQKQPNFKPAAISSIFTQKIDKSRRRDKILWLNEDKGVQSQYLQLMNELQEQLNRELFLGIQYYESNFAHYEVGDFYETHYDAFMHSKNRIVTSVYYLNEAWDESDGGELIIYDEENNFITKVLPHANTLVVFLSEKFPHEVLTAKKDRFSIAGWFRIDPILPVL